MAHFAEIDNSNKVLRVVVINNAAILDTNGNESESNGIAFCQNLYGGTWVQTSYNKNFRSNFAGVGFTYDATNDVFIPEKPFDSWVLNSSFEWEAPTPKPEGRHRWDESTLTWISFGA